MATINGTSSRNRLTGTKFDDIINGFGNDDVLDGLDGNDWLYGGMGFDTLTGGIGDDHLYGEADDDTLNGNEGNDVLDGGTGTDTMAGGIGDDTYYVDHVKDVVTEAKKEGTDTVYSTISYKLTANVENLHLQDVASAIDGTGNSLDNEIYGNSRDNTLRGEGGDDELYGNDGVDWLYGGSGNDLLNGGNGGDQMYGGIGNDDYHVDDAGDRVTENRDEGIDDVFSDIDYVLTDHVENLILSDSPFRAAVSGTGNDLDNVITGNRLDNVLDGRGGNDTLISFFRPWGVTGADTLIGGEGDDRYIITGTDDTVIEHFNEGIDTVVSATSYTLPNHVENLEFAFGYSLMHDVDGTGNGLDNIIRGSDGINVLSGGGGDDELYGYEQNDVLVGGSGDDTLDGGTGADTMLGGTENDSYTVDDAGDTITELANEGADWVRSSISWTLGANLENLALLGLDNLDGTGNELDNFIAGNRGNNILSGGDGNDTFDGWDGNDTIYGGAGDYVIDGGPGIDTLIGGIGNDTYYLIDDGNTITENLNEGTDHVISRITHTLAANVENLTLHEFGGAINGTGNALGNVITGNSQDNTLSGSGGADTLIGGEGIDQLFGGNQGDTLDGGFGDDILDGGSSHDTLIGGVGVDLLTGGVGNDTFQFNLPTEGADIVADFGNGTDRVAIDNAGFGIAGTGTLAANGVDFVLGSAATGGNATLMFDAATHQLMWDADGTGAGASVLLATLLGVNTMVAGDFLIV